MQTLFSLYIPKHFGEISILPKVLRDFLEQNTNTHFEITISPGYLGEGAGFIKKASDIFLCHVGSLTIYRGMTSQERLVKSSQDFSSSLSVCVSHKITENDHRKMMFFRYSGNTEAILIGSSNFSKKTYFGKDKGEADLLLFYDDVICQYYRRMINEGGEYNSCVLSGSIAMRGEARQYLNAIYDEFINNAV